MAVTWFSRYGPSSTAVASTGPRSATAERAQGAGSAFNASPTAVGGPDTVDTTLWKEWNASNTGSAAPGTLTPSGDIVATVSNTTYQNLFVTGNVRNNSVSNITYRNCYFLGGGPGEKAFDDDGNVSNIRYIDCTMVGTGGAGYEGITGDNTFVLRCNISGFENNVWAESINLEVANCYIHDLNNGPGTHADAAESNSGIDVTFHYNVIYGHGNSAVYIANNTGQNDTFICDANILRGDIAGASWNYAIYVDDRFVPSGLPINAQLTRNRISHWQFGPWFVPLAAPGSTCTISGNVNDTNGAALP